MKTTIKGTVHTVETQTGTSEKGEWKRQTVVIKTSAEYKNLVPVGFFNKDIDVVSGDVVEANVYVGGREYKGRYYADIDGDTITVVEKVRVADNTPPPAPEPVEEDQSLPF